MSNQYLSLLSSKASRPLGRAGVGTQREGEKKLPAIWEKIPNNIVIFFEFLLWEM